MRAMVRNAGDSVAARAAFFAVVIREAYPRGWPPKRGLNLYQNRAQASGSADVVCDLIALRMR